MPMLEVLQLKKYFATQKAVDDISFILDNGSIFGLLGPNGAGKTTLIRMITGIFYPDEGNILLNSKKFNPDEDAARIGYMPEERGLYKKMKIGEQAIYFARLKGLSRHDAVDRIKKWFVRFEMQSWWNKKIEDLSKGMAQKLQFVITVLHEPELIILDEPFSGLDPVNANLIKDEIFRLAKNGSSIIFSTHRMEQVEEICDHIILINKGQKILDGSVSAVKQEFKENLFRLTAHPLPEDNRSSLFDLLSKKADCITLRIKEGHSPNEVLEYFINRQSLISDFRELLPSLNDIFIRLVEGTSVSRQFQNIQS
ncbi:MAG: ATP-binding cassette domain-containing protein [Bacteroidota bacterium]|nr:ATP-binding cassette domain-containing protein [Bacteroidota bacterium]MDP4211216.1 ATP-binding cassette domain-containing protein [Bacteroidota bacterium]MDP4251124.1 ATP-binding cassette domain-containing protein [Bacteroidota bacterium]